MSIYSREWYLINKERLAASRKTYAKIWEQRPEVKERRSRARRTEEYRARQRQYRSRPEVQERRRLFLSRPEFRAKNREYCRRYRAKLTIEQRRAYKFQRKYQITLSEYDALFEKQGRKCAICGSDKAGAFRDRFPVDHDHKTGRVRGILCHPCNRGIGFLRDDTKILSRAIQYLKGKKK